VRNKFLAEMGKSLDRRTNPQLGRPLTGEEGLQVRGGAIIKEEGIE